MPKIQDILITNQLDHIYIEAKELVHQEKIEGAYKKAFEMIHNRITLTRFKPILAE